MRALGMVVVLCATAHANPLEIVGLTSRHAAQAGAGVASVDDAAAVYYDPAGLGASAGKELSLGTVGAASELDDATLHDRLGIQVLARAPVPLRGPLAGRITVGIALHLLPHDVVRVTAPAPGQVFYPAYSDRLQRIVVLPGVAVRVADWLSVGAAVDTLAGLTGTIDAQEGATRAIDARVDERVGTIARLVAGAQIDLGTWRFGATYRQKFEVPFHTTATTLVAGEPIDLDVSAVGLFTPHEVIAGAAYVRPGLVASLDVGWQKWSDDPGPYVKVDSMLPLVGAVPGDPPPVTFSDTISVRAGVETRRNDEGVILRAGYAYESSGAPTAAMLRDGDHHTIAVGLGWQFARCRLDAHVASTFVGGYGELLSGGLTLEVGL